MTTNDPFFDLDDHNGEQPSLEDPMKPVHPNTGTFDISKWLSTGDTGSDVRVNRTVKVYQNPELIGKAHALKREAEAHNRKLDEGVAEDLSMAEQSRAGELQQELDALEQQIKESEAEVRLIALSDEDVEEIQRLFKQRYPSEKTTWDNSVKGTCLALAHKTKIDDEVVPIATFSGNHLSAETWRKLSNGVLAGGQWQKIKNALIVATRSEPRVDSPF